MNHNFVPHVSFNFQQGLYEPVIRRARDLLRDKNGTVFHWSDRRKEYFIAELVTDESGILLLVRASDLYITGFVCNGIIYEFKDMREFNGSVKLPYLESYPLEINGDLGFPGFHVAVATLIDQMHPGNDMNDWQNNIFLVVIHFAEALRFNTIADHIFLSQQNEVAPIPIGQWILLLIRNWSRISVKAANYTGPLGGLNETAILKLQGVTEQNQTFTELLEWILMFPRLCRNLVALSLNDIA